MYEIGDFVVKAGNGICRVEEITKLDISLATKDKKYYMLVPIEEAKTKLYIPVDKENNGIRRVMTKEEAEDLVGEIPQIEEAWIADDKQRETRYKEIIHRGEPRELVSVIKSMYTRKQKRSAMGKKSTSVDERFFKLAESNLYAEFAFALGERKEDMLNFISNKLDRDVVEV